MNPLQATRNGYSLADCAEILLTHQELKTEHGEPGFQPHFQQFLQTKGLTESRWSEVWNDWHQTTEADPALGAKFHTYLAQERQQRLIATQPDVSADAMEGVTLAQYAKISAQSQTGAAIEGLVAGEGLTMDQWRAGQAAWGAKMSAVSPTDPLILQYGQLYQRWAPNHQASMEASTQAVLEDAADRAGRGGGMNMDLTVENASTFFDHDDIRVQARGAREMVHLWDIDEDGRTDEVQALTQRAHDAIVDILKAGTGQDGLLGADDVQAMDIHAFSALLQAEQTQQDVVSQVHGSLADLASEGFLSPDQNEAAQEALRRAIARLQPRAAQVEALFERTSDELKRTHLRQLTDDYRETLEELEEALDDWDYSEPDEDDGPTDGTPEPSLAAPVGATPDLSEPSEPDDAPLAPSVDEGILGILRGLPVIGDLLKMLGI